jgi:hypothetical protein
LAVATPIDNTFQNFRYVEAQSELTEEAIDQEPQSNNNVKIIKLG